MKKTWQERYNQIVEWLYSDENFTGIIDCPLIKDHEFIENDPVNMIFKEKFTWKETGETVIIDVHQTGQGIPHYTVDKVLSVKDGIKTPWKRYEWSIVGGVTVIARNDEESEQMAEYAASGAWDILLDSKEEITYFDQAGPDVEFANWKELTPQAKTAILALAEKIKSEEENN